ncbi:hypothetical protein H4Q26_002269 [Puccinia striiformis f. sp. tritici PST-130]|nr:hypothetical protein H4Q26_002269 [Puccinia striiformis f. sp. tritici PST-130]
MLRPNRTNEDGLLELELEESFMSPIHDAIPKPPEASTSIEQIRLEDSRFDSIDAIMEEVEGNHHQGSLLEIDSEFGGDGEVEESFMSTFHDSIPKPTEVTTSIERIRLENSRFLSSNPVDEMMEEVENNHLQESLLEMDSEFGGDGEVEESFMSTIHNSMPKPTEVTTSIERIRLENSRFLSSDPVDEMMQEVGNNHLQESLLEMDSEFGGVGDDDLNLPTSAQQSTSTFHSFNLRNASVVEQHSDLTSDPLLPHWVDSTSILATKLDGTKIRIPRRRKIGSDQLINGPKSTEALQKQCLELLDQPIHRMLQSVREEILHKEALALAHKVQGQWNSTTNSFTEVGTGVDSDPYGRPQEKVLLLAGKPGLGKTTMAEVLAIQAGYQVIEINASDDRNAGAKFGGGLSLKSNRPTCIIIDEIDGAAAGGGGNESGFVKALVKLVIEGSSNLPKFKSKGKNLDQRPLLRPIICICNDLYAPVLRPLRPISKIIRFNNPTQLTIVKRLQSICKSENLVADLNNLNYLVKLASGDLRSCLNTLQFISIQSHTLTDQIIKSAVEAAVKDSGSSIQNVLTNLFRIPIKKSVNSKDPSGSKQVYLNDLVRDISICGQNERIIQGCLNQFYDRLETKIWKDQEYQLMPYVPYSIAIWRELMGNLTNKPPDILKILSVDLRPINGKLIQKNEKDCLDRLVNIMVQLRLKFVLDKSEDGQLSYNFDPPLDIPPPRYSVRQMILNEMNLLSRGRKQDQLSNQSKDTSSGTAAAASIINAYKQKPVNALQSNLPEV